ncbi:hypothetical protein QUA79_02630 [Microcoleus sp. F8-D1]
MSDLLAKILLLAKLDKRESGNTHLNFLCEGTNRKSSPIRGGWRAAGG